VFASVFVFYAPVAAAVVIIIILCMVTAIMGTPTWRAVRPRLPSFRPSAPLAHEEHGGRPFTDDGGSKSCIKIASTLSLSLVGLGELMKDEGTTSTFECPGRSWRERAHQANFVIKMLFYAC
jgi:hypothetical protein